MLYGKMQLYNFNSQVQCANSQNEWDIKLPYMAPQDLQERNVNLDVVKS